MNPAGLTHWGIEQVQGRSIYPIVLEKYRGTTSPDRTHLQGESGVLVWNCWTEGNASLARNTCPRWEPKFPGSSKRCHPTETNRATVCQLQSHSCATGCPTNGSVEWKPHCGIGNRNYGWSPTLSVCISYVDANQRYRFVKLARTGLAAPRCQGVVRELLGGLRTTVHQPSVSRANHNPGSRNPFQLARSISATFSLRL